MEERVYLLSLSKWIVVGLLFLGTISCTSTETLQQPDQQVSEEDTTDLESLYWERIKESRMDFTQADVKFMTGMIAHHAQALIMSRLAPENNANPEIQRLAARIINAQKDEIASMQQWLEDRDQPVPEIQIDSLTLTILIEGEPFTSYKNMPGVLSQQQLVDLSEAQGGDFDRLFLEYMIEHHSGAVGMVKNLFSTDGAAQDEEAFRLASDIQVDQITEIERMNLMLDELSTSDDQS